MLDVTGVIEIETQATVPTEIRRDCSCIKGYTDTLKLSRARETGGTYVAQSFNRLKMISTGTLMVARQYNQFAGNVHVMKAVASDMVLTFCSRSPDNQLYSLLLSREHILQKSDKRGVHNLLGRRGLKIVNIRETCMNNAAWRRGSFDPVGWLVLIGVLSSFLSLGSW